MRQGPGLNQQGLVELRGCSKCARRIRCNVRAARMLRGRCVNKERRAGDGIQITIHTV